ncbi:MAG TPA: DUF6159 family protein [Anaerolineales bacterium]|nr:DUF6159 family protein [Anaerolineales bacterium]
MESIKRGFGFFKQAWAMAFKDRDLLKPTIYALVVGFIVSLIGLVPIVGVALLFGDTQIGNILTFTLGMVLVFVQYTISYLFASMTIHMIYGHLAEGDRRMDQAWSIVRRDFLDILSLAAASTGVKLIENVVRGKNRSGGRNILANLINTVWTEATYLVLPAMVIEDIGLRDGLKRATQIVKENLLLVGVSTVGVGFVTGVIGFLLSAAGLALGFGVGFGLFTLLNASTLGIVLGIGLGGSIALVFILLAVLIGSYTATAYHTCLYLWARDVERSQASGAVGEVAAPAPLASVLNA